MKKAALILGIFVMVGMAFGEGVGRTIEQDTGQDNVATVLSKEDRDLLEWAKAEKAKEKHRRDVGHEIAYREEMWLDKGREIFTIFHAELAKSRGPLVKPAEWNTIAGCDQKVWAHLAKIVQSDLCGTKTFDQKLNGFVDGDYFVISGRFREVGMFCNAVRYLQLPHLEHGQYSTALDVVSRTSNFLEQCKDKPSGSSDSEWPVRARWRIKGNFTEETVIPINEVIEIWPGEIIIQDSPQIRGRSHKSAVTDRGEPERKAVNDSGLPFKLVLKTSDLRIIHIVKKAIENELWEREMISLGFGSEASRQECSPSDKDVVSLIEEMQGDPEPHLDVNYAGTKNQFLEWQEWAKRNGGFDRSSGPQKRPVTIKEEPPEGN